MFEDKTGRTIPQIARTVRGYDRCKKCRYVSRIVIGSSFMLMVYRSQHVKCDGVRPVCTRCHGKGYACIYVPKRSPWTVYASTNSASRSTIDHDSSLSLAIHPKASLSQSVASLPSRQDWSGIFVDVHALMQYCKKRTPIEKHEGSFSCPVLPIDAGYVPSGYLREITTSKDLIVSYASLPALYQSILQRKFETDPAVLSIRGSVLECINKTLRKSNSQIDDYTIISIKHQLYYDCFISSKPIILAHLDGLYQIVHMRGGLHTLGLDGDLAHMLKV